MDAPKRQEEKAWQKGLEGSSVMRNRSLVAVVFVLLCLAAPVAAQDMWEIAGGYSFTRAVTDEVTLPAGWLVSGAGNVTDTLAIVGEVNIAYKTEAEFGVEIDKRVLPLMGGVRYSRRLARVTPFAQFLLGAAVLAAVPNDGVIDFAIQPGAGVDIRLTDRLAARVQGDWRRIFSGDEALGTVDGNQIRIAAGIVVGFRRFLWFGSTSRP